MFENYIFEIIANKELTEYIAIMKFSPSNLLPSLCVPKYVSHHATLPGSPP